MPTIVQDEGQQGFYWLNDLGERAALREVLAEDDEPERLLPTHLEALDDALIIATGEFGQILGGSRRPSSEESRQLRDLHRVLDRLCAEFGEAATDADVDVRAGQIIGTATLVSIMARQPLGLLGPAPLEGELDAPPDDIVGGFGDLVVVDETRPWAGARWVVRTTDGLRLPASLSMLLHNSSGVNKDAALVEHRDALQRTVDGAQLADADPFVAACALDWMVYDFLMAHRDGPDSGAIDLGGRTEDAVLIVRASAESVRVRAQIDPGFS